MVIAVEQTVAKVGKLLGTNSLCVGASLGGAEPKSAIFRRFVRANNELHERAKGGGGGGGGNEVGNRETSRGRGPEAACLFRPRKFDPLFSYLIYHAPFPSNTGKCPSRPCAEIRVEFRDNFTNFFLFLKNVKFWKSFEELFSVEILVEEFLYLVGVFFSSFSCDRRNAEGGSNAKTRERSVIWRFYIYSLSVANYSSRGIEIFIPESRILSLLRHLSNSVTLFILVGITMCVKARAYKWWTVLKGKWTGHVIVLSRRNPRDTYPKHVSRSRDWAGVPACLVRTRMARGRFTRINMETRPILERNRARRIFL